MGMEIPRLRAGFAQRFVRLRPRPALLAGLLAVTLLLGSPPTVGARSSATVVRHGSRAQPVVALTFDDGWSSTNTWRIFEILEAEQVPATFFPVAPVVARDPELWRAIAAAGFPIGNHTKNHPDLRRLPDWRIRAELNVARATIEQVTGQPMLPVFRPPDGLWNARVLSQAAAAGYPTLLLWDVDTGDWQNPPPSIVAARALAGRDGSIVLMHASLANTPAALRAIIAGYRARGFRFVTVGQLLGIPGPVPVFDQELTVAVGARIR